MLLDGLLDADGTLFENISYSILTRFDECETFEIRFNRNAAIPVENIQ